MASSQAPKMFADLRYRYFLRTRKVCLLHSATVCALMEVFWSRTQCDGCVCGRRSGFEKSSRLVTSACFDNVVNRSLSIVLVFTLKYTHANANRGMRTNPCLSCASLEQTCLHHHHPLANHKPPTHPTPTLRPSSPSVPGLEGPPEEVD